MITAHLAEVPFIEIEKRVGLKQKEPPKNAAGGFEFVFSRMEPGGFGIMHADPECEHVLFTLSGSITQKTPEASKELNEMQLAYLPPGELTKCEISAMLPQNTW